ncbi:MAG: universal stress protein [Acidobacteria bacterium]|nr:universal stress protein [Acidobacteriota bacterium]
MIARVVVGVDFSEASKTALARGREWAQKLGVPLEALHVMQPPAPMLPEAQIALPDPAWLQGLEQHAKEQLDLLLEGITAASGLVRWGNPAEELVRQADATCLLVIAQVGHSTLERILFGSTAARVVRFAPCDVLVVRTEPSAEKTRR